MSNVTNLLRGVKKSQDEWYTPAYAVKALLPFLNPNSYILCPFDTSESQFVKVLKEAGHKVDWSHINDVTSINYMKHSDFFDYTKEDVKEHDYIISNPPYSKKDAVFEKLFELERPFFMLMGSVAGMFEGKRFSLFEKYYQERARLNLSLIWLYPRVAYIDQSGIAVKSPPFQSAYISYSHLTYGHYFVRFDKKGG